MSDSTMKTLRTLTTVLVCLAIVFAFLISVIQLFGFELYGVMTGSMKPAIPSGSMIYLRDVNPDKLRIGDVITYSVSPNVMATHRIVDIVPDAADPTFYRFQTKGDANQIVDAVLVEPKKIVGKVAFSIPYLGSVARFIQKPPGMFVAIGISIVLIALVLLTDVAAAEKLAARRRKEKPKAKSTETSMVKPMDEVVAQEPIPEPRPVVEAPPVPQQQQPPAGYAPPYRPTPPQGMPQTRYVYGNQYWQQSPQPPRQPMQTQGYYQAYQQQVYTRPAEAPVGQVPANQPMQPMGQPSVQATPPSTYRRRMADPQPAPPAINDQPMTNAPTDPPQPRRRRRAANPPSSNE